MFPIIATIFPLILLLLFIYLIKTEKKTPINKEKDLVLSWLMTDPIPKYGLKIWTGFKHAPTVFHEGELKIDKKYRPIVEWLGYNHYIFLETKWRGDAFDIICKGITVLGKTMMNNGGFHKTHISERKDNRTWLVSLTTLLIFIVVSILQMIFIIKQL